MIKRGSCPRRPTPRKRRKAKQANSQAISSKDISAFMSVGAAIFNAAKEQSRFTKNRKAKAKRRRRTRLQRRGG